MQRRQQTTYLTVDPLLSPRGKVLHGFEHLADGLAERQIPCVWVTGLTRAQLDEPRRRLGANDPYIGEGGCGVYLPEDYFHLSPGKTMRLGRFTCIPVASPQPAAAEALEELASDLDVEAVSLRSMSQRELSQNTGLSARDAEQIRMRDFDELFFFAGATDSDATRFAAEARLRGLTLRPEGAFWSLSKGADLAKCIRELGALYDRALRAHAYRIGVAVSPSGDAEQQLKNDPQWKALAAACDRVLLVGERSDTEQPADGASERDDRSETEAEAESLESTRAEWSKPDGSQPARNRFSLHQPGVWEAVIDAIVQRK